MGKTLITGASGFIGSHLIRQTAAAGLDAILITSIEIEGFRCVNRKAEGFPSDLERLVDGDTLDSLIHLGAYTPKAGSLANLLAPCNSNITETANLLSALPTPPRKIIYASTLDVYRFDGDEVNEETLPDPPSLYGASKLYGEHLLRHWCAESGSELESLRIGHVYGPGEETYQKLIPTTILNCLRGIAPKLRTDGSELRSFIHVEDICRMILSSLGSANDAGSSCCNLVSSSEISIRSTIETILRLCESSLAIAEVGDRPGISTRFDNRRMVARFGPERISFEEGLASEIEYLRRQLKLNQ
ncbi:MAG: SDR family oxidoreductase [Verrucomicrobiae bacterium]|nr:SDR family oxidoreductase [Verrucomicrobiae bacterium]